MGSTADTTPPPPAGDPGHYVPIGGEQIELVDVLAAVQAVGRQVGVLLMLLDPAGHHPGAQRLQRRDAHVR